MPRTHHQNRIEKEVIRPIAGVYPVLEKPSTFGDIVQRLQTPTGDKFYDVANSGARRTTQTGRAYDFDGTDDYVDIGNQGSSIKTIAFRIKADDITSHTDYVLDLNGTDYITIVNGEVTTNGFSAATVTYYVDGVSGERTIANITDFFNVVITSDTGFTASDLDIGQVGGTGFFNGKLFDVRLSTDTWTSAQVTNYTSYGELGTAPTNVVAWYKCDEQAGLNAFDSSGNRNDGTITNATLSTFHSTQTVYSFQNQVGYTLSDGTKVIGSDMIVNGGFDTDTVWTKDANASITGGKLVLSGSTGLTYQTIDLVDNASYKVTFTISDHSVGTVRAYLNGTNGTIRSSNGTYVDYITAGSANTLVGINPSATLSIDNFSVERVAADGAYIPRDESDPTKDVLGATLEFSGKAPQDAALIDSHCGTFDGTDDSVVVGDVLDLGTNDKSVSVRVNSTTTSGSYETPLYGKNNNSGNDRWMLYIHQAKAHLLLIIDGANYSFSGTSTINDGEWHTITATIDRSDVAKIYVDGVLEGTSSDISSKENHDCSNAIDLRMARDSSSFLNGSMCDVRDYQAVLSADNTLNIHDNTQGVAPGYNNLQGCWPLAEGAGVFAYDTSGNGNHGTITDATLSTFWGSDQDKYHFNLTEGFTRGLFFSGSSHVDCGNNSSLDLTSGGAVSAWISPENITTGDIVNKGNNTGAANNNYSLSMFGGSIYFFIGDGSSSNTVSVTTSGNLTIGSLHHVVGTFDGTNVKLYIDGVEKATLAQTVTPIAQTENLLIADSAWSGSHYTGVVFDTRIYNDGLTADEVTYLYNRGASGTDPTTTNLVAKYDFSKDTGSTVIDEQGSNTGTITGALFTRIPKDLSDVGNDALGAPLVNPAGTWHNGAETDINFNPNSTPELTNIYKGWAEFNGSSSVIEVNHSSSLAFSNGSTDSAFSIACWIRPNSSANSRRIISKGDDTSNREWLVQTGGGGQINWALYDGGTGINRLQRNGATSLVADIWNHVVVTYDGSGTVGGMNVYLDGQSDDGGTSNAGTYSSPTSSGKVNIGRFFDTTLSAQDLKGLKIFNKELTSSEVQNAYNGGSVSDEVLDMDLAGNSLDSSGNANNGAASNITFPTLTVDSDYSFEESLGEQNNHFKRVHTDDKAYAILDGSTSELIVGNQAFADKVVQSEAFSVTANIKVDPNASNYIIFSNLNWSAHGSGDAYRGIASSVNSSGEIAFQIEGTGSARVNTTEVVDDSTWHTIIVNYDGSGNASGITVYIDGTAATMNTTLDTLSGDSLSITDWYIGSRQSNQHFTGDLTDIRLYDAELTSDQRTAVGEGEKVGTPLMWYKLEKDGKDYSGNELDATSVIDTTFDGYTKEDRYLLYSTPPLGNSLDQVENYTKTA